MSVNKKKYRGWVTLTMLALFMLVFMVLKLGAGKPSGLSAEAIEGVRVHLMTEQEMPSGRAYTLRLSNMSDMTLKHNVVYLTYILKADKGASEKMSPMKVEATGNRLDILPGEVIDLNVFVPNEAIDGTVGLQLDRPYIEIVGYMQEIAEVMRFVHTGPLDKDVNYIKVGFSHDDETSSANVTESPREPTIDTSNEEVSEEETSHDFKNYDTALTEVETVKALVDLYRLDLSDVQFAAYGYKSYTLFKELGTEAFIEALAAEANETIHEGVVEAMIHEMKLVEEMNGAIDLQAYADELDQFLKGKDRTTLELKIAYNLKWQIRDL